MQSLNDSLKEISLIKLLIVAIVAIFIMVFLEDIFQTYIPVDFLSICLLIFIVYEVRNSSESIKLDFNEVLTNCPFKAILIIVILNILFSYGMIYLSDVFLVFVPGLDAVVYTVTTTSANIFIVGSLISSIIIAPLSEELIFRGVIFNRLNKHFSISIAILVSSFLFGICHDFGGMFSAFIFGICMCILYIKTANIFVPMIAHGLNNLFSEIIAFSDFNGLIFSNDIIIISISILAIISAYILFSSIKQEWQKLN